MILIHLIRALLKNQVLIFRQLYLFKIHSPRFYRQQLLTQTDILLTAFSMIATPPHPT